MTDKHQAEQEQPGDDDGDRFEAGDHVTLSCNAAGGIFPYDHHAIVVSVGRELSGEQTLCVSDFTAPDDYDGGASDHITDVVRCSSGSGLNFGSRAIDGRSGSGDGIDDDDECEKPTKKQRGLRVLCVPASKWSKVRYHEDAPVDPPKMVRRRVEFLLRHPHLIPSYSLLESNCECVAVWCKTGRWTTLQAQRWLGGANLGSRAVVAGLSVAWYSAVALPVAAPLLIAAGVVAEVASGVCSDRMRRAWEDRARVLNEEFDVSFGGDAENASSEANSNITISSRWGSPFDDARSIRDIVNAHQRADTLLAAADQLGREDT